MEGMETRTLATQLCAPEGPTVGPAGWVLNVCSFTRDPTWPTVGGDITATHPDRPRMTHRLFSTSTDQVNGIPAALAFGPDGALYITDEGRRAIVRVGPNGQAADMISECDGMPLNGPNDLSFDPHGNLFFTDPWTSSLQNRVGAVYGYDWGRSELHRVDSGLAFPNGIVVRDDRLYVAETLTNKVWIYDVVGPGRAAQRDEFCSLPDVMDVEVHGPDGMAFDADGNLYVAHFGGGLIHVYSGDGTYLRGLAVDGRNPTNVCFGGPDFDVLYTTVDDVGSLVAAHIGRRGDRLNFCPSGVRGHPWEPMLPLSP